MKSGIPQICIFTCVTLLTFSGEKSCFGGEQEKSPKATERDDELSELGKLASSDPVKDFEAAKAKNDIHFIGINGITLLVPGVGEGYQIFGIEARVVKGTSDFMESEEQLQLTKRVLAYAEKYNELVLRFLSEKEARERRSAEKHEK